MKIKKVSGKKIVSIALALLMGIGNIGMYTSVSNAEEETKTFTGSYLLKNDVIKGWKSNYIIAEDYEVKVSVDIKDGKIISVKDNSTSPNVGDKSFWDMAVNGNIFEKFNNINLLEDGYSDKIDKVDVIGGATVSSRGIKEAVKVAAKKYIDSNNVEEPIDTPKYKVDRKFTVKLPVGLDVNSEAGKQAIKDNIHNSRDFKIVANDGITLNDEEKANLDKANGKEKTTLRKIDNIVVNGVDTSKLGEKEDGITFDVTYDGVKIPVTANIQVVNKYWIHIHAIEILADPTLDVKTEAGKQKIIEIIQNTGSFQIRGNVALTKEEQEKVNKANGDEKLTLRKIENFEADFDATKPSKGNIEHALNFVVNFDGEKINLREKVDVLVTKTADNDYKFNFVEKDEKTGVLYIKLSKNAKVDDYIAISGYPKNIQLNEDDIKTGYISANVNKSAFKQRHGGDAVTIRNISDDGISEPIKKSLPLNDEFEKPEKAPRGPKKEKYSGTEKVSYYIHEGSHFSYPLNLKVEIKDGRIINVKDDGTLIDEHNELWLNMIFPKFDDFIGKSYEDIDKGDDILVVSGATWSKNGAIEAVKKAMIKASEKSNDDINSNSNNNSSSGLISDIFKSLTPEKKVDIISINRVSGKDRIDTAVEISKKTFNKADTVILVNGYKNSDALTAVPYATSLNAPILFTNSNDVTKSVLDEISRLGAKNIIIIGGQASVDNSIIKSYLKDKNVERLSGADRYETAKVIAEKFSKKNANKGVAILVNGRSMVDALSIPSLDEKYQGVVLLTDGDKLNKESSKYIKDNNIKYAVILGGSSSVSLDIEKALNDDNINTMRIAGKDRYETSRKIVLMSSAKSEAVVASGENFADALSVGVYVKKNNAALLVTKDGDNLDATKKLLKEKGIKNAMIVGGKASISENVRTKIAEAIK